MKVCSKCRKERHLGDFTKNKSRADGLSHYCRDCVRIFESSEKTKLRRRMNRVVNPDGRLKRAAVLIKYKNSAAGKSKSRAWWMKRRYGISVSDFDAMLVSQNGECAIGGHQFTRSEKVCIDHDHSSGNVRGLLCLKHNFAIGLLGDSPETIISAYRYISGVK